MASANRLSGNNGRTFQRSALIAAALALGTAVPGLAATYYVAPTGSNSNAGTLEQPFASMQKGHDVAAAGDTVFFRGGTYAYNGSGANSNAGVNITKSGTSDTKRICYWAYKDEKPVFDFAKLSLATTTSAGIRINGGNWLYFKGLEIKNVPQPGTAANNGIWANPTSNTIFENCVFHHNSGPGLSIANGNGGILVLNCDSHNNYDPNSSQGEGQNADGFGVHYQKSGPSTVLRGCRAWWNSDDGFDCISQGVAVTLENCVMALSGYKPGTFTSAASGNGNGFKVGGWGNPPDGQPNPLPVHTVRNSVALLNKAAGFYHNHQPGNGFYYNNTSFNNRSANYNMLGYSNGDVGMGTWRNNISFTGTATSNANGATATNNSWNISGLTVTASDFQSVDTAGMFGPGGIFGPRKADGSLPDSKFLRLSAGSKLIDKGVDVGLPFKGTAPDLGAFEYDATTAIAIRADSPETAPAGLSGPASGFRNLRIFDLSGRKLDGPRNRSFQPIVYMAPASGSK